jgi:iterative type I PKS product template protein
MQSEFGTTGSSTVWTELGPKPICLGMIKSTLDAPQSNLIATANQNEEDWATLSTALTGLYNIGLDINWNEVHREYEPNLRLLELPSYAFDLKNYWIQYEGDWSIVKGKSRQLSSSAPEKFSTTSMHRVESEIIQEGSATIVFSTNFATPSLRSAVDGHQVNRVGLCPSSLYADMAMTAAAFIYSRLFPDKETPAIDVADMEVNKPFVINSSTADQYMTVTAQKASNSNIVHVTYTTLSEGKPNEHAHCIVSYGNASEWLSNWSRQKYLIQDRIRRLKDSELDSIHMIHRRMVYKLFSVLVNYSDPYQGITKAYLDSEAFEAAAYVKFRTAGSQDKFYFSPYWIDSLLHLSGFVLNGSDMVSEDAVYISHGWQSLRLPKKLEEDKTYITYVRMQPLETDQVMTGDVYIFDGDCIVGLCSGLKFQKIRKSILGHLLPARELNQVPIEKVEIHQSQELRKRVGTLPVMASGDPFKRIIEMIAQEAQVSPADLDDNVEFVDIGIDSLLSLIITAKLREMTDKEIPGSLFITHPTVCDLRSFFQDGYQDSSSEDSDDSQSLFDHGQLSTGCTSANELVLLSEGSSTLSSMLIKSVISDELGVPESSIQPDTEFADLGLDSLLSLVILSKLKNLTGQTIDPEFFIHNPTFGDILKLYDKSHRTPESANSPTLSSPIQKLQSLGSIILQGRSNRKNSLFLFPDGSGSAASYMGLPLITNKLTVYGLNSPHLHNCNGFDDSIESIASYYISEIRAQKPNGPYILGGWSVGGVYAYEAARQLVLAGESVLGLILIDSPCPKRLPPMSLETIDLLTSHGMFGSENSLLPEVR